MVEGVQSDNASLQSSTVIMPTSASALSESLQLPTPPRGEFPVLEPAYALRPPASESVASATAQVPEAGDAQGDERQSISEDDDKDSVISVSESEASSFFDVDAVTTTTESVGRVRDGDEFDFVDEE